MPWDTGTSSGSAADSATDANEFAAILEVATDDTEEVTAVREDATEADVLVRCCHASVTSESNTMASSSSAPLATNARQALRASTQRSQSVGKCVSK